MAGENGMIIATCTKSSSAFPSRNSASSVQSVLLTAAFGSGAHTRVTTPTQPVFDRSVRWKSGPTATPVHRTAVGTRRCLCQGDFRADDPPAGGGARGPSKAEGADHQRFGFVVASICLVLIAEDL